MRSSVFKIVFLFFVVGLLVIGIKARITKSFLSDTETQTSNTISTATSFCEQKKVWTANVVIVSQGTLKNGNPINDPNRKDPTKALGPNDWVPETGTNFFSLGVGGTITLSFNSPVLDGAGADLSFHEATNGRPTYPEEKARVEVSRDGTTFLPIGEVTSEPGDDGVTFLDFSSTSLSSIKFVKLTDTTNFDPHAGDADGYDLDAVDGVYGCE